jgi:FkbM family methyltransferase
MLTRLIIFLVLTCSVHADKVKLNDYYSEWHIFKLVRLMTPEEAIIVNAGAHRGDEVAELHSHWPKAQIHAFEPNPQAFEALKNRMKSLPRVILHPFALNDVGGTHVFHLNAAGVNARASSLLEPAENFSWYYKTSQIEVPCKNLDAWADENGIDHIDFLWLDVGGAELRVLSSSPRCLSTLKAVYVETHLQEFRKGLGLYADLKQFLLDAGFEELKHWHVTGFQGQALFAKKGLIEIE